jgi:hypothetical protein
MALRRGRNSIPSVNPNPRPPNEPRPRLSQAQPVSARVGLGQARDANASRKNVGKPQAGNRSTPGAQSPAASPPPAAPQLAPPTDPRDARYWQDLAQLEFNKNIGEQQFNTEDVFDKTRYGREKSHLDYLAPIEIQRLREGANTGGAIYSTATQENLGNLGQEQFQRRASLDETFQQALSMRALQRNELIGNYNLGSQNLGLEAAERASAAEAERQALAAEMFPEASEGGGGQAAGETPIQAALKKRLKPKTNAGAQRSYNINMKPKNRR